MQIKSRPASLLTYQIVLYVLSVASVIYCHGQPKRHTTPRSLRSTRNQDCQFDIVIRHSEREARPQDERGLAGHLRRTTERDDSECGVPFVATESNDQSPRMGSKRIFNGFQAKPGQFPWVVRLRLRSGRLMIGSCTGSIVSSRHVLTAAHCITGCVNGKTVLFDPSRISAWAGRVSLSWWSLSFGTPDVKFEKYFLPKAFNACQPYPANDYAVLVANKPMELRSARYPNSTINRVCLPGSNLDIHSKTSILAGWGETYLGGGSSSELMWTSTQFEDQCYNETQMFCALGRNSVVCLGDSGGPATIEISPGKWTQVAIITAYDLTMGNCTKNVRMFFNGAMTKWIETIANAE